MNDQAEELKHVLDEAKSASSRISETARYAGFGLASLVYVFATSESSFARYVMENYRGWVVLLSIMGCLTILLDYIQFIFAYKLAHGALDRIRNNDEDLLVSKKYYYIRSASFELKQWIAVGGVLLFGVLIIFVLFIRPAELNNCKHSEKSSNALVIAGSDEVQSL